MPDLVLSGTAAGQATTDAAAVSPFANVTVSSSTPGTPYVTATVAFSSTANGALSQLGDGGLSADGSTYTVTGSPAAVQAALRALVFTPVAHEVPVGQSATTGFTLTATDAAGAVSDTRTSVVAAAAATAPVITDTTAQQPAGPAAIPQSFTFSPFAFVSIADAAASAADTTTIALTQNGAPSDAVGVLTGAGLTKTGVGTYVLATASPAAETAALQALAFNEAGLSASALTAQSLTATLTVSNGVAAPVTTAIALALPANPGGSTVITNSTETLTTYADTTVMQATHTYATTIDAVLNNGTVVYERTFALAYADPQVQAGVAAAKAALIAAGATPGAPQQTVSNLAVLSSQMTAVQSGPTRTTSAVTSTTTTFGPNYVLPNVGTALSGDASGYPAHSAFFVYGGQADINVNTVNTNTVPRTVTTTSTDLLSQQYVIAGTAAAGPPVIGGTAARQALTDKATLAPFAAVTVTDAGAAETVTIAYAAANGALAGAGFTSASGGLLGSFASAAAAQAALRALVFTPTANQVVPGATTTTGFTLTVADGQASATDATTSVAALSINDAPVITGASQPQTDAAGVTFNPFAVASITDPDVGQTETVTVSFAAGAGVFAGMGFTGAGGSFTGTFASAAAAQAALRAAAFTPTAGASATDVLAVAVQDAPNGAAMPTTASTTITVVAATGGGVAPSPLSVQSGLLVQFQNIARALATGADALNPQSPIYAAFQAEKGIAAQLDTGQLGQPQAEAALDHLVDGTTAVAVASYAFFTGYTPSATGLNYLVHSSANAADLNSAYYSQFSTENRYINLAVNLATGPGIGAAAFQATYGSLSLADATAKAYLAVFGVAADATKVSALLNTLVPDGLGGQETRATYFAQYGGDGPNGQGTKAAMIGFLLSNAVHDGSGIYGAATEHYVSALAHGTAPAIGSELALSYGPAVSLVGSVVIPDPVVTT